MGMAENAPRPAAGFSWVPSPWGIALRCDALAHVAHGWTARPLRLRGSGEIEQREWAQVAEAAGVPAGSLVRLHQVHETTVHLVSHAPSRAAIAPSGVPAGVAVEDVPRADIAVATTSDAAVAVQVADCVPLLIAGRRAAAAVHAGWRGTAARAAEAAVDALVRCGEDASQLVAAIGPSIGPCCYEVGAELPARFGEAGCSPDQCGRWFSMRGSVLRLDLWLANRDQLVAAGVPSANVHVSELCTSCHPGWFHSYRRDGAGTGRMAGFIRPS